MNISNLDIGLVAALLSGVGLFFRGLRTYREYLRVQGTPGSPIGTVSMGLVRVHGKPSSERLLESPARRGPKKRLWLFRHKSAQTGLGSQSLHERRNESDNPRPKSPFSQVY